MEPRRDDPAAGTPVGSDRPEGAERMEGALAKYRHAQTHLKALRLAYEAYEQSSPYEIEEARDVGEGYVRFRLLKPPPADFGLILGDAVHNLRGALDFATCSLCQQSHGDVVQLKTQFPFGDVGEPLSRRQRQQLGPIETPLLEALETARACGGLFFELLNKLSNQDKHRLLVATAIRRFPVRLDFGPDGQSPDFVSDFENDAESWFTPLADGNLLHVGQALHFKAAWMIEGDETPYVLTAINQINRLVSLALRIMAGASIETT
jgi:hypothetical protein